MPAQPADTDDAHGDASRRAPRHGDELRVRLADYGAIALIALASRLVVFVVAYLAVAVTAGTGLTLRDLLHLMEHWDAGFYWSIAWQGYETPLSDQHDAGMLYAFFPVYPLLIRVAMTLLRVDQIAGGVIVSTTLFVVALCLVRDYVRTLGMPREVALASALLVSFAPQAFVFSAIYSESTFLFLLAAATLALHRRRYVVAGVAAALLSATRPNGVLFVVFVLVWIAQTFGWRAFLRPWAEPWPFLTAALAPLGLVAYWWFCFRATGDAFAQATASAHFWGWAPEWPWVNLAHHLRGQTVERFWALGSLAYAAVSLLLVRHRLYAEFAFCAATLLLVWSNMLAASLVRYCVVLFPIFVVLARAAAPRPVVLALLAAAFATLNGMLTVAFVLNWVIAI